MGNQINNLKKIKKMSELYNAIMAWEDEDKSYEAQPLKEDSDDFMPIQEFIKNGTKLSAEEKDTIQKKVYEYDQATNDASGEGNQARALILSKVCKNLEFALQYYQKYNPN